MGINYNAKIASSGLVLHLDAGNTRTATNLNKNLFVNTEDFTNSYWAKNQTIVTANQALAPDGTFTADLITATSQYPIVSVSNPSVAIFPVNAGEYYTVSCYVKYVNQRYCVIVNEIGVPNLTVEFDLINGTVSGSSYAYGITNAGNGWWRIYATYVIPSGYTAWNPQPIRIGQYGATNYNGSQMYAWGAQLEMGTTPTTYYPVNNGANPTSLNDLSGYDNHASLLPYTLTSVEVLVVGGGGGAGYDAGGGGGGGGVIYNSSYAVLPSTTYTVTVGGGGAASVAAGPGQWASTGGNSVFDTLVALGGGGAGSKQTSGLGGGSGGGAGHIPGNFPGPAAPGQGFTGGIGDAYSGGGGGGAGGVGANAVSSPVIKAGDGGPGILNSISGTATYYGAGGAGGSWNNLGGTGGLGGGGNGGNNVGIGPGVGTPGTGYGAGGGAIGNLGNAVGGTTSGAGFQGIVIVRYLGPQRATGGTVTTVGDYTIHTFTSIGSTTFVTNSSSMPAYSSNYGGVLQFNGTNNFLIIPNSSSLSLTGDLTISTWYYATSAIGGMGLIIKGPEQGDYDYMMYLTGSSLTLNFYKKDLAGTGTSGAGGGGVTTRAWYNSVVVVQSGVYSQYVNGALIFSSTLASSTIRTTNNPVRIGRGWSGGYFQGYIGPTYIYNRALSATEVLGNFNAMRGRFGV